MNTIWTGSPSEKWRGGMHAFRIFPISLSSLRKGTNLSMDIVRFFSLPVPNNAPGEECKLGVNTVATMNLCVLFAFFPWEYVASGSSELLQGSTKRVIYGQQKCISHSFRVWLNRDWGASMTGFWRSLCCVETAESLYPCVAESTG